MVQKPLIIVTGSRNYRSWFAWRLTRYALKSAGAKVKRLIPGDDLPTRPVAGIVIGGGDDLNPRLYGQQSKIDIRYDDERDRLEWSALELAERHNLPVLGICRGSQLLNVFYGGTLHQDLKSVFDHWVMRKTVLPRKWIEVIPNTPLSRIMGRPKLRVNSLHHQAVNKLGRDFVVAARDEDGIVQAVAHCYHPFRIGVQWHPEMLPQLRSQRQLFKHFVQAAEERLQRSGESASTTSGASYPVSSLQ